MKRFLRRFRQFWLSTPYRIYGSFLPSSHDGVVRLRFDAPTGVKQKPVDYEKLGVL